MLLKRARVVAMTCAHAAADFARLRSLGFGFDTLVAEGAAPALEAGALPPLALAGRGSSGRHRLRRAVLLGDRHDGGLFGRLLRGGARSVALRAQGRARPAIADLCRWRYPGLEDMPHTRDGAFALHNAGMRHAAQLVHVKAKAEPEPDAEAEARWCVLLYLYLRACGHGGGRVAILTAEEGQKALVGELLRSSGGAEGAGGPRVETVDAFQGQQRDIVIVSLGRPRDARRVVAALSRARLGLYAFGSRAILDACADLRPALQPLLRRPQALSLVFGETHGAVERRVDGDGGAAHEVASLAEMASIVKAIQEG